MNKIILRESPSFVKGTFKKYTAIGVLVDENTKRLCYNVVRPLLPLHHLIEVQGEEKNKNLATCEKVWQQLTELHFDRHSLLVVLGGGVLGDACTLEAAPKKGLLQLKEYNHFTVSAFDAKRSNQFYKDVFGTGVRSYQGPTAPTNSIGPTVAFLMYTGNGAPPAAGAPPRPVGINHVCLNMDNFKPDEVIKTLESYGIKPRESQTGPVGPLRHYISMRMENRGGAKEGTPELYFTDPDGILLQLQDSKYCGGGGFLGDSCPPVA